MEKLKEKTISGVIWSGFEKFCTLAVQATCGLIIARYVSPHDYGTVGIIMIFITICNTLVDSGFSQVLIRKQRATSIDYSTIFFLNLISGIVLYWIIFFISPYIETFYQVKGLSYISRIAFLTIPLNSTALVQYTILQKKLNFKLISKISIFSVIISALVGVILAYLMKNAWALVIQNLTYSSIRILLLWILSRWRPIATFSFQSLKEMLPLSMSLLAYSLLSTITNNIYGLIIGKSFSTKELGLYSQAEKLEKIPSESFTDVINKVTYPILSKLQDSDKKIKDGYRKIIKITFFFLAPLLIFLSAEANIIFSIILPPEWAKASIYFSLLCWVGVMFPLHKINLNILIVKGQGKINLTLEIIRKSFMILILFCTINFGIIYILLGYIFYSFIALFLNMYYCGKLINLSIREQFSDILPTLVLSLFFFPIKYAISTLTSNPIIHLFLASATSLILYILISYILHLSALQEILKLLNIKK